MLDVDTLTWSQPKARGAGTGAEPSPRCFHSAALCGKNLFVLGGQVHYWLLANNHYVHGTYILETTKLQWEHNTIKGDSFIPYPGASLLGHTGTAADSSSLYLGFGVVESTNNNEYAFAAAPARLRPGLWRPLPPSTAEADRPSRAHAGSLRHGNARHLLRPAQVLAPLLGHCDRREAEAQPVAAAQAHAERRVQHDLQAALRRRRGRGQDVPDHAVCGGLLLRVQQEHDRSRLQDDADGDGQQARQPAAVGHRGAGALPLAHRRLLPGGARGANGGGRARTLARCMCRRSSPSCGEPIRARCRCCLRRRMVWCSYTT